MGMYNWDIFRKAHHVNQIGRLKLIPTVCHLLKRLRHHLQRLKHPENALVLVSDPISTLPLPKTCVPSTIPGVAWPSTGHFSQARLHSNRLLGGMSALLRCGDCCSTIRKFPDVGAEQVLEEEEIESWPIPSSGCGPTTARDHRHQREITRGVVSSSGLASGASAEGSENSGAITTGRRFAAIARTCSCRLGAVHSAVTQKIRRCRSWIYSFTGPRRYSWEPQLRGKA